MVSKIVGLSLLAALASTVNAYTWYVHLTYENGIDSSIQPVGFKIHPIDVQVPGNDVALVLDFDPRKPIPSIPPWNDYGYGNIDLVRTPPTLEPEMDHVISQVGDVLAKFPCKKIEQFEQETSNTTLTWKVYNCANADYYGKKGIPFSSPTTTASPVPTTSCPIVTVTVPVTVATTNPPQTTTTPPKPTTTPSKPTTTPPTPSPTCLPGYKGKRNGKGPNGACCSHSDDCKDTCVKGVCGVHP